VVDVVRGDELVRGFMVAPVHHLLDEPADYVLFLLGGHVGPSLIACGRIVPAVEIRLPAPMPETPDLARGRGTYRGLARTDRGREFLEGKASEEVADMCYSYKDHEAREAQEEARRRAKREREERRRREGGANEARRRVTEKERELVRA